MRLLLGLSMCCIVGVGGSASADDWDDQICAGTKAEAAVQTARGPVWIDSITQKVGTDVDCVEKIIIYKRSVTGKMPPNYPEALQQAVNERFCDDPGQSEAIRHGWGIAYLDIFADGNKAWAKSKCR
jgi:hypothetical protein